LLGFKLFSLHFFRFFFEDSFNENSSVFELVTFGGKIEFVIESAVDLLCLSVLPEESPKNSLPADPEDLSGHPAFPSTSTFTSTSVIAFALSFEVESCTSSRVHFLFALHDKTVLDEFTNEDTRVGLSDLLYFVGIHPNALSSALQHLRC
jgi:hypothetical protein